MATTEEKPKGGLAVMLAIGKKKPMDSASDSADSSMTDEQMPEDEETEAEPDADDAKDGKQYLTVPKGFNAPSDVPMGGSFSGTFRGHMDEDGRLCVEALNNVPLTPDKETPAENEGQTDEQNAPQDVNSALKQTYQ